MEIASEMLPIILYLLLSILVVVSIIFMYKMIITINKTNLVLDDVYTKIKKMDNFFDIVDKSADTINLITDKMSNVISKSIFKIWKKRRKADDYE